MLMRMPNVSYYYAQNASLSSLHKKVFFLISLFFLERERCLRPGSDAVFRIQ